MSDESVSARARVARAVRPWVVAVPVWIIAGVYLALTFHSATMAARAAEVSTQFPRSLLGMPVLTGFRDGERFGVHLEWGTAALLVAPAVLAALVSLAVVVRQARAR